MRQGNDVRSCCNWVLTPEQERNAQIRTLGWIGKIATGDFLDAMHAVHERIAVQEQQSTALLGVAVVFQIDFQCPQQIGLVLAIVTLDDVERGMQQAVDFGALANGVDQRFQCSIN